MPLIAQIFEIVFGHIDRFGPTGIEPCQVDDPVGELLGNLVEHPVAFVGHLPAHAAQVIHGDRHRSHRFRLHP